MRPRNYVTSLEPRLNRYLRKRSLTLQSINGRPGRISVLEEPSGSSSEEEPPQNEGRSMRARRISVLRTRRYISEDEDDDEPIFTPQPPRTSNRIIRNTIKQDANIRRSQRQRKLKYENCNDSWILGSQSARGYPAPKKEETIEEEVEEEEEEEVEEEEEEVQVVKKEVKKEETKKEEIKEKPEEPPKSPQISPESSDNERKSVFTTKRRRNSDTITSDDGDGDCFGNTRRIRTRNAKNRKVQIKYSLRKTKPTVQRFQVPEPTSSRHVLREMIARSMRKKRRRSSSSSSSSSSYERDRKHHGRKDHGRKELAGGNKSTTGKLADVDPINVDQSINFSNIGGLEKHVSCLKEMILFPILYPEIFSRFGVSPPKGVLFHGPPGTGKTLMARALANECSLGDRKVSFFMRKGADCLSKWVGESERQLRILFQEAHQGRPSIIFFDELDGLAPVRSSKQDQIHASIVCTLLALMDGLDNRGDIIVIGATNRIDSIDPALRRPGRFDRELHFPLPGVKERREILTKHAETWAESGILNKMAETTAGYCGSDLKALCTEAVIQSLKRVYPQIYDSKKKLLLNHNRVRVTTSDFERAQRSIVPAAQRAMVALGRKLPAYLEPLLSHPLAQLLSYVGDVFPTAFNRQHGSIRVNRSPSLLIVGEPKETSFLATSLLYKLEHCPTMSISLESLYSDSSRSPEETVTKVFKELPHSSGSILWMGDVSLWWNNVSDTVKAVFTSISTHLDPSLPILFLATSQQGYPNEVSHMFSPVRNEVFKVEKPTKEMRENFLRPLFKLRSLKPPPLLKKDKPLEQLEEAPPTPPPKLTQEQIDKLNKEEENTLRELRIFLRQICSKLARNKQFYMFSKPVDIAEVPDYLQVIQEPMDLETMMTKIDHHGYNCAEDFLKDIDKICANALEYNPDRDPADKHIRHNACYLRDTAYALIKAEMDSDFEVNCRSIREARVTRTLASEL